MLRDVRLLIGLTALVALSACSKSSPTGPSELAAAATPLSVAAQPQSQTIQPGSTATMSVAASGSGPVTYQWYAGSTGTTSEPISGAKAASYTTPALTDTANYWVRLSNTAGATDSATATITVTKPAD